MNLFFTSRSPTSFSTKILYEFLVSLSLVFRPLDFAVLRIVEVSIGDINYEVLPISFSY
jgi:hypothetical protein